MKMLIDEFGWMIYPAATFGVIAVITTMLSLKDSLHDFLGTRH
jgi:hypothetical protein